MLLLSFSHDDSCVTVSSAEDEVIAAVNRDTGEIQPKRILTPSEISAIKGILQLGRREARRHKKRCGDFVAFAERLLSLPDPRTEAANA